MQIIDTKLELEVGLSQLLELLLTAVHSLVISYILDYLLKAFTILKTNRMLVIVKL